MRALVTGGCGYIGSHTCVKLLEKGCDVTILDNLSNSSEDVPERIERICSRNVTFVNGDVRDEKVLDEIFSGGDIEWVLHFAGLKAVGESCSKPIEYYDNNIIGTLRLVEAMKRAGCEKIIFSSSACVYGDPEVLPLTEDCPVGNTTNPYGTTKYFQERILEDAASADEKLCAVLLRYFNPVGAHSSALLGEDPKGVPNNLTPYVAKVAVGELERVGVFGDDYPTRDGTGVRDYIHVEDLAEGHVAAMEKIDRPGVHCYNLGTGRGYSVLEVIAAFERACGRKIPYKIMPRRPGDVAECWADPSKAKRELGWEARLSLDDMCASLWNFWQKKSAKG